MIESKLRRGMGAAGLAAAMLLAGCDGFFVDPTSTTGTTGSSTADYVYVANSGNTLSEFVLGPGTLTAISGSPISLGSPLSTAQSVAVSRGNAFVFVGGIGGVLAYSIGTTGALTEVTSGGVTESADFVSLDTSPDGQYLFGLDSQNNEVWVFGINKTTGALIVQGNQYALNVNNVNVAVSTAPGIALKMAPSGGLLGVAIGVAGDEVFSLNTSTGALTPVSSVNAPASGFSDDSVAFDGTSTVASTHLLVGRGITAAGTSQILSFAVTSAGVLSGGTGYASGQGPYSLLVDNTGGYLYSANRGDSNLSGYALSSGVLTALPGSPFKNGDKVTALAEDLNHKYVIAAASGGTHDVTLYAMDVLTAGQLDAVATFGTGTAGSLAIAATQ